MVRSLWQRQKVEQAGSQPGVTGGLEGMEKQIGSCKGR